MRHRCILNPLHEKYKLACNRIFLLMFVGSKILKVGNVDSISLRLSQMLDEGTDKASICL